MCVSYAVSLGCLPVPEHDFITLLSLTLQFLRGGVAGLMPNPHPLPGLGTGRELVVGRFPAERDKVKTIN